MNPDHKTIEHYRAQVRTYLDITGAGRGLVVLMSSGVVITVVPSDRMMAA
ncbi:hypothetical protein AAFG07_33470 [Bradyrhizobium sp. B097]